MVTDTTNVTESVTPQTLQVFPLGLLEKGFSGFSLDSLCVNIPLENVEVLNDNLFNTLTQLSYITQTGEFYESRDKDNPLKIRVKDTEENIGSHREYAVHTTKAGDRKILRIWFSSKSLGSLYFLGITPDTLPLIYQKIQEDAQVSLSYETLLRGRPTDFDVKRDFLFKSTEDLLRLYRHLEATFNPSRKIRRGVEVFEKDSGMNVGININERRHTTSVVSTFLKSYFKGGLLLTEDRLFLDTFLSHIQEDTLRMIHRQEFTISGRTHSKALGLGPCSSLEGVLSIPDTKWEEVLSNVLQANFWKLPMKEQRENSVSLRQKIVLGVVNCLTFRGITMPEIREILLSECTDKHERHKVTKEIREALHILAERASNSGDKKDTPERLKEQAENWDRLFRLFDY